jgi:hypothetical protein
MYRYFCLFAVVVVSLGVIGCEDKKKPPPTPQTIEHKMP